MKKWVLFNMFEARQIGDRLGYENRELAEIAAKNYSTIQSNWYAEIGVFELVSKAKYAPQGELTRLDEGEAVESQATE